MGDDDGLAAVVRVDVELGHGGIRLVDHTPPNLTRPVLADAAELVGRALIATVVRYWYPSVGDPPVDTANVVLVDDERRIAIEGLVLSALNLDVVSTGEQARELDLTTIVERSDIVLVDFVLADPPAEIHTPAGAGAAGIGDPNNRDDPGCRVRSNHDLIGVSARPRRTISLP